MASNPDSNSPDSLRAADILESITDAFFALDHEWRFTYVNRQAEQMLLRTRAELLGKSIWDEFPEAVGSLSHREYQRAVTERTSVSFDDYYAPLATWFENHLYPSPEGLSVYFRDINARKQAEAALRDAHTRLDVALAAGGIATWDWDLVNERLDADANLARLFSLSPEAAAVGTRETYFGAVHPDDQAHVSEAFAEAVAHQESYEVEFRVPMPDGATRWLAARGKVERDAAGRPLRLPGVVVDITEQAERGRRERFLAELAERSRRETDPEAVIADAVRSLGEFLGASRCVFADIDFKADVCTVPPDYCADESVASMAGSFPISAFGPFLMTEYGAGRTVAVEDVRVDPVRIPPDYVGAYNAVDCRAFIAAPVLHSARLVSVISVHSTTPRRWTPEEIEMVQTVVDRTWLTVEVLRQKIALGREAEEQRERAEREALLNRIGQAIRATRDPEAIQETAAVLLGEALEADRCFYVTYDLANDDAQVAPDWHRDDLGSLAGSYRSSDFGPLLGELFPEERTAVVEDVRTAFSPAVASVFEASHHRALLVVPFYDGGSLVAALYASMSDTARAWTSEEVILVEQVATTTRTTLEAALVSRKEHAIAQQLQDALQPALPEHVPGLVVASFTRPALQEAQVGGDFFDIFPLDKELYALVIGDVSGKGLAAAQQLALIRNSLRTTLYLSRAPAQAVAGLNAIVTAHDLLVGFVTAFVGVYDAATGVVTYASCGHEPGLVRRAAGGVVEELTPTGPPLGIDQNAEYGEAGVTLSTGDALLLYTDGLSEAGPSRRELLGTAGLTRLLASLPESASVPSAAETLVAQVADFAGGVFRDDVAVLLARRQ